MELKDRGLRPNGMMTPRQVRRTAVAGLLCTALAGCGSTVASSSGPAAAPAASSASAASSSVGCASVSQATSVTVHRSMHLVEPSRASALSVTQRKPAMVQTLFGDFCDAVRHRDTAKGMAACPADFGTQYTGTFYAGTRTLARFLYSASGCERVSIISGSKTQSTLVFGDAAKAAPNLQADLAAVLGVPESQVAQPATATVNPGGTDKAVPGGTNTPLR